MLSRTHFNIGFICVRKINTIVIRWIQSLFIPHFGRKYETLHQLILAIIAITQLRWIEIVANWQQTDLPFSQRFVYMFSYLFCRRSYIILLSLIFQRWMPLFRIKNYRFRIRCFEQRIPSCICLSSFSWTLTKLKKEPSIFHLID